MIQVIATEDGKKILHYFQFSFLICFSRSISRLRSGEQVEATWIYCSCRYNFWTCEYMPINTDETSNYIVTCDSVVLSIICLEKCIEKPVVTLQFSYGNNFFNCSPYCSRHFPDIPFENLGDAVPFCWHYTISYSSLKDTESFVWCIKVIISRCVCNTNTHIHTYCYMTEVTIDGVSNW